MSRGTTAFLRSPGSTRHNVPHCASMAGFKPQNDLHAIFPTRRNLVFQQNRPQPVTGVAGMAARKQSLTPYGRLWSTNQGPLNAQPSRSREPSGSRHDGGSVTDPGKAVFLSYASQDAVAAQRMCNALRAAGIEVWFDQSELRGGDVWDQKIRREIHDCALFIPVISANTASRHEGYFRLEWDLADQRTHMLARNRAFIVPVCLDALRLMRVRTFRSRFSGCSGRAFRAGRHRRSSSGGSSSFSQASCTVTLNGRRRAGRLRRGASLGEEDPHEARCAAQSRSLSRRPPPISLVEKPWSLRGLRRAPSTHSPRRRTRSRCCRS